MGQSWSFRRPPRCPLAPAELLEAQRWRHATKVFDPSRAIPPQTWEALEDALVLSASSFGLQPWTFLVIADPALRAELRGHSWNQAQITDSSHLVVIRRSTSAALLQVDSCPIEGFSPPDHDGILGLEASPCRTAVVAALGYRSADDKWGWLRPWAGLVASAGGWCAQLAQASPASLSCWLSVQRPAFSALSGAASPSSSPQRSGVVRMRLARSNGSATA